MQLSSALSYQRRASPIASSVASSNRARAIRIIGRVMIVGGRPSLRAAAAAAAAGGGGTTTTPRHTSRVARRVTVVGVVISDRRSTVEGQPSTTVARGGGGRGAAAGGGGGAAACVFECVADGHNGCPACARVPRASARREAGVHGGVLSFGNGGFKFVYFRNTITRLVF